MVAWECLLLFYRLVPSSIDSADGSVARMYCSIDSIASLLVSINVRLYGLSVLLLVVIDRHGGHIDRLLLLLLVVDRFDSCYFSLVTDSSFDRFALPESVSAIRNALLLRISTGLSILLKIFVWLLLTSR